MGITRKHHAMRISGRGILAGRFTRNIDYNSDNYGDGITRISLREHLEQMDEIWDWDEATAGFVFKKTDGYIGIWTFTWGYSDKIPLGTPAAYVDKAYAYGWTVTIEEWEAMGSPWSGYGDPITEGPFAGYVKKVDLSGTWVAPTFYSSTWLHNIWVDQYGNIHLPISGGARFDVGRKFLSREEMFAWADSVS